MKLLNTLEDSYLLRESLNNFLNEQEDVPKTLSAEEKDKLQATINSQKDPNKQKEQIKKIINSFDVDVIFKQIQTKYFQENDTILNKISGIFFSNPERQQDILVEALKIAVLTNCISEIQGNKLRKDIDKLDLNLVYDGNIKSQITQTEKVLNTPEPVVPNTTNNTTQTPVTGTTTQTPATGTTTQTLATGTTTQTPETGTPGHITESANDLLLLSLSSLGDTINGVKEISDRIRKSFKKLKKGLLEKIVTLEPFNYIELYNLIMDKDSLNDSKKREKFLTITYDLLGKNYVNNQSKELGISDAQVNFENLTFFGDFVEYIMIQSKKISPNVNYFIVNNNKALKETEDDEDDFILSKDYWEKRFLVVHIFLMSMAIGLYNVLYYFIEFYDKGFETFLDKNVSVYNYEKYNTNLKTNESEETTDDNIEESKYEDLKTYIKEKQSDIDQELEKIKSLKKGHRNIRFNNNKILLNSVLEYVKKNKSKLDEDSLGEIKELIESVMKLAKNLVDEKSPEKNIENHKSLKEKLLNYFENNKKDKPEFSKIGQEFEDFKTEISRDIKKITGSSRFKKLDEYVKNLPKVIGIDLNSQELGKMKKYIDVYKQNRDSEAEERRQNRFFKAFDRIREKKENSDKKEIN